jgi:hypothetical protein
MIINNIKENPNLKEILGKPKFEFKLDNNLIGEANIIGVSPLGGALIKVSSIIVPMMYDSNVTGNIGDELKDSIKVVQSFLKSNNYMDYKKSTNGFHIHFNTHNFKLDGFSGSLGIAMSLCSLFNNKSIDSTIAFLGALDLYGRINKVNSLSDGLNFDNSKTDTDVPVINESYEDSKLYKYIIFCGQRSGSTFGMADQNIANAIDSGPSALESSIPVYGGIADMFQAESHINNLGLISGESCVAKDSDKSLGSQAFTWDEAKYYQRFVEDQRLAENMGLVEESSVSVALRHYYEKNPIDTSYEGTLAYYSGMTKEKVIDTLDMMEGMVWIAGYDPSDLYPYKTNVIAIETKGEEKQQNVGISVETIIIPKIAYVAYRKEYNIA